MSARDTTAELWDKIQARSAELGVVTPPGMFQAVNEIRSAAAQLRNSAENLSAAPAGSAIVGSEIAFLPYGTRPGEGGGPRVFDVRVAYNAVRGGVEESDYVTLRYTGGLPATVGDLRSEAALVTESLVEGYGASFTGIGTIQIGEL